MEYEPKHEAMSAWRPGINLKIINHNDLKIINHNATFDFKHLWRGYDRKPNF